MCEVLGIFTKYPKPIKTETLRKPLLLLVCCLLALQYTFAQIPTLGTYPSSTIATAGRNGIVAPSALPTNAKAMAAATSTAFKGQLSVDSLTGTVRITNAHPAGTYTVTITAFNGAAIASSSFVLVVNNTDCSQAIFTSNSSTSTASRPEDVAVGDFNGDGKQDFVTANGSSGNISVRLGDGTGLFTGNTNTPIGTTCSDIAIADFNGDGKQDLIISDLDGKAVYIKLGDGNGGFSGITNIALPNRASSVAVGDFNNDGKKDFIVSIYDSNVLSTFIGDGAGNFVAGVDIATGDFPRSIVVSDFNNDGNQDVAVGTGSNGPVLVSLGNGAGGFAIANTIMSGLSGLSFQSLAVGDFNNDNIPDLILTANSIYILRGNGTGGFVTNSILEAGGGTPECIAVGDFNGDGNQDIAIGSYSSHYVSVRVGNGSGGFAETFTSNGPSNAYDIAVGDFNNDGRQDIIAPAGGSSYAAVFLGSANLAEINLQGNGITIPDGSTATSTLDHTDYGSVSNTFSRTFTIQNTGSGKMLLSKIAIGGIDSSQFTLDLIRLSMQIQPNANVTFKVTFKPISVGVKNATVNILSDDCDERLYNFSIQGTGTIVNAATLGNYPATTIIAGGNTVVLPTALPTNASGINISAPVNFTGVLLVDSLTGKVSITKAYPAGTYLITVKVDGLSGAVSTFLLTVNNPACSQGLFSNGANVAVGTGPTTVAVGDFNNDGKQDMAVANTGANTVSVRLGNGVGGFTGGPNVVAVTYPTSIGLGDFNKDGKLDFVTSGGLGFVPIAIRLGDGAGGFTSVNGPSVGSTPQSVAVYDFDRDGNLDFLMDNSYGDSIGVFLGDGKAGFKEATRIAVPGVFVIKLGDFNRDGFEDFVTTSTFGRIAVRLGDGTGNFTGTNVLVLPAASRGLDVADFNGDGILDICATSVSTPSSPGLVSIRLGNGTGNFYGSLDVEVGFEPVGIVAGDFNGDGKADFATGNANGNNVSIRLGDGNGGFTVGEDLPVNTRPQSLAIADLDNNGSLDLLACNLNSNNVSVKLGGSGKLDISGNGNPIAIGDITPSVTDHTDFGNVSNSLIRTFTMRNSGITNMLINNINSTGVDSASFKIGALTFPILLAPNATSTFTVEFLPTAIGIKTTTVKVSSNNCLQSVYNFAVQGNGTVPTLPTYPATTIATAGGNTTILPSFAPTTAAGNLAYTAPHFKGLLQVNQQTGIITVTNAYPAGIYTVTVKAGGFATATTSFLLTVNKNICSQGSMTVAANQTTTTNPKALAIADFNSDGKQDLATANFTSNSVSIRLGNGSGGFTGTADVSVGTGPIALAVGDFNADGNPDIATVNRTANTVSIRLGNGAGGFIGLTESPVGTYPSGIAVGDFNGDGQQDLAVANTNSNNISICLGNGVGGFTGTTTVLAGTRPIAVALGDFNGDGKLDIAASNDTYQNVSIRLGDGAGNFTGNGTNDYGTAYNTNGVAIADFNNDGKPDFAASNYGSNSVTVRFGDGTGAFPSLKQLAVGVNPTRVTTGDFDGDGNQDIATANYGGTASILLGDGEGNFAASSNFAMGSSATGVVAGDFNGDGRMDLAISKDAASGFSLLTGRASNVHIVVKGYGVEIVDGDVTPSFADSTDFGDVSTTIQKVFTIQNTGTDTLAIRKVTISGADVSSFSFSGITTPVKVPPAAAVSVVIAFTPNGAGLKNATVNILSDDCDKILFDFAIQGNGIASNVVLGGYPATTTALAGSNATVVPLVAPTNANRIAAFTTANFKGSFLVNPVTGVVSVLNAGPAGTYLVQVQSAGITTVSTSFTLVVSPNPCSQGALSYMYYEIVGNSPQAIALGDFNNDGKQDVAVANKGSNTVSIRTGTGTGDFAGVIDNAVGVGPMAIAAGDFNGDGKQDIVVGCKNSNSVEVRLGNGAARFGTAFNIPTDNDPRGIAVADFNADGKQDLAIANGNSATVSIRLGDGAGSFTGTLAIPVGNGPSYISLADFNNDGFQDFATANFVGNSVSVRLGNGAGSFSGNVEVNVGNNPKSITIGDFNNDGYLDMAVANSADTTLSVLLGNGLGNFSLMANVLVGKNPCSIASADFNGDGKLDVAATNYGDNTISIRFGNGSGGFAGGSNLVNTSLNVPNVPIAIVASDFNSDGKQDFLAAFENTATINIALGISNEINIKGNNVNILDGTTTPAFADFTDFGNVVSNGSFARTFTIQNTGNLALNINSIQIKGIDSAMFAVSNLVLPTTVASGGTKTFVVTFSASSIGSKTATVVIANDDCDESSYDFALRANGVMPTLGTYAPVTISNPSGDIIVLPSTAPTYTNNITAYTSADFKGLFQVDTATGAVYITNAYPAGTYNVTVKVNGPVTLTSTFVLTVANNACGQGLFAGTTEIATGAAPQAIAVGDFNNDGKQDLAIGATNSFSIAIRFGDGNGGFIGTTNVSVPGYATSIMTSDFNGDGYLDFSIATNNNRVYTRLGSSAGTFTATTDAVVGTQPQCIVAGDFNSDGKQDFAVANSSVNSVSIGSNDGRGNLISGVPIIVGTNPVSIGIGDFNGDGKLDFATANNTGGSVSIRLGNGAAGSMGGSEIAIAEPTSIAVGDINGDGKLDIVGSKNGSTSLFFLLGDGNGGFATAPDISIGIATTKLVIGDFNNDGKQDIAAMGANIVIRLNDGNGGFFPVSNVVAGTTPNAVAIGDFNKDGRQDLAIVNSATSGTVSIRLGASYSPEINVKGNNLDILDGDTIPSLTDYTDFDTTSFKSRIFIIQNTGASNLTINTIRVSGTDSTSFLIGAMTFPATVPAGQTGSFSISFLPQTVGIKTAQVNIISDDCDEQNYDFRVKGNTPSAPFIGTYPNTIIAQAGGNATVRAAAQPANAGVVSAFTTPNFNGLIQVDPVTGTVSIINAKPAGTYIITVQASNPLIAATTFTLTVNNTNCGSQTFVNKGSVAVGNSSLHMAIGDFNRDGKQDIAVANYFSNNISIRLGDGLGAFTGSASVLSGNGPVCVAIGDFNSDGKQDLAIANVKENFVSIRLGNGIGGFKDTANVVVGQSPQWVAVADFNMDGKQDLAIANSGFVSFRFGNGRGGFTGNQQLAFGGSVAALVVADFNGDNKPDIAICNSILKLISISLGDGLGNFGTIASFATTNSPYQLIAVDYDKDGVQDLAVTDNASTVNILKGNGTGSFTSMFVLPMGGIFPSIAFGDINGDGLPDILGCNISSNNIAIATGVPGGSFSAITNLAVGTSPVAIVIGDFNTDGKQDFAVAINGNNTVTSWLGAAPEINIIGNNQNIKIGDITADVADFTGFGPVFPSNAMARTYTIQNLGTVPLSISSLKISGADSSMFTLSGISLPATIPAAGSLNLTITFNATSVIGIKTTNVIITNNDCDEALYDFAIAATVVNLPTLGAYVNASVLVGGNTSVVPSAMPASASTLRATTSTDFKGSLFVDPVTGVVKIVNAHPAGTYLIKVGVAPVFTTFNLTVTTAACNQGTFSLGTPVMVGANPRALTLGDFNGDGIQNLAVCNYDANTVSIRLGNGSGRFVGSTNILVSTHPVSIAVGDFNGDGKQDIAVANVGSNSISIRLGDGNGGFTGNTELPVGTSPQKVVVADFNLDGKDDLAITNYINGTVAIRLGDGSGGFAAGSEISVGNLPWPIVVGDFNSDGKPDFAIVNYNTNNVAIRLGNGVGGFTNAPNVTAGVNPISINMGDFNGDGKQDLLIGNFGLNKASVRFGDGAGNFTGTNNMDFVNAPWNLAIGDFNGDGKQDFISANSDYATISVRLNDGVGVFNNTPLTLPTGGYSDDVVVGDFNGDGRQDLAATSSQTNTVVIYLASSSEINLQGNYVDILAGDTTASLLDHTDFGVLAINASVTRTYTIKNVGTNPLVVTSVRLSGMDSTAFTRGSIILPLSIPAGDSSKITVSFTATGPGSRSTKVVVSSNDCDEATYDFVIQAASPSNGFWLGNTSDWSLPGNWSTGRVPDAGTQVIINAGMPFMPEVSDPNSMCYSLRLNNGSAITIKSGGHLTVVKNN